MRHAWASGRIARLASGGLVFAGLSVGASMVFEASAAGGHARFHAIIASICLGVALALVLRFPATGLKATAPAVGFSAFGLAQLTESLGAFGYGPDNDSRVNGLVFFHDLGLGLSALGLVSVALGVSVGVGLAFWRVGGAGRWIGAGASGAALIGGLFVVKALIGL